MNKFSNYNFFPKSRKGADKLLSIYWFAILFIVAAAVVYMAVLFYGKPYDVREIETNLLVNKVADCLMEDSLIKPDVFSEGFKSNFLSRCGLNFETEEVYDWNNDQYYIELKIFSFGGGEILRVVEGNTNLRDCSNKLDKFPFCVERSFYALDQSGNQYEVNIFSAVRKTEKNVR